MQIQRPHSRIKLAAVAGRDGEAGARPTAPLGNSSTASRTRPWPATTPMGSGSGTGSGGHREQARPGTFIGWRLVARIVTWAA